MSFSSNKSLTYIPKTCTSEKHILNEESINILKSISIYNEKAYYTYTYIVIKQRIDGKNYNSFSLNCLF